MVTLPSLPALTKLYTGVVSREYGGNSVSGIPANHGTGCWKVQVWLQTWAAVQCSLITDQADRNAVQLYMLDTALSSNGWGQLHHQGLHLLNSAALSGCVPERADIRVTGRN